MNANKDGFTKNEHGGQVSGGDNLYDICDRKTDQVKWIATRADLV